MANDFGNDYKGEYEDDFDDDEDDEDEDYKKIPIDEYEDLIFENEELREENNSLLRLEINEKYINDSIIICSNDWFWSWKSIEYKVQKIKEVYLQLKDISEDSDEIQLEL